MSCCQIATRTNRGATQNARPAYCRDRKGQTGKSTIRIYGSTIHKKEKESTEHELHVRPACRKQSVSFLLLHTASRSVTSHSAILGAGGVSGADTLTAIDSIDKQDEVMLCIIKSMFTENIAQLADRLDIFDQLYTCSNCDPPDYVTRFTRCGKCDQMLEDEIRQEDSLVLATAESKEENEAPSLDSQPNDALLGAQPNDAGRKRKHRAKASMRSGTEKLIERPDLTKINTKDKTYLPQKRISGSVPVLVQVDKKRTTKMRDIARIDGFGNFDSGKEVCMREFKYLLLFAGYSEGSWKHEPGCDYKCNRTCAGSCRNDGNPHTYPRSMNLFFDADVVKTKADFFVEGVREDAKKVALQHAIKRAHASKKWNKVDANGIPLLSEKDRAALTQKLAGDIMHGFDGYVYLCKSCHNNPALLTAASKEKEKRPSAQLHDPGSPSLAFGR